MGTCHSESNRNLSFRVNGAPNAVQFGGGERGICGCPSDFGWKFRRELPQGNMRFNIEIEQEEDGRWIAEIPELPGVMAYGATRDEVQSKVEALALSVIADRA